MCRMILLGQAADATKSLHGHYGAADPADFKLSDGFLVLLPEILGHRKV